MKALKVGLLVNGTFSDKYVHDLALWARDREDIKISHLIIHPRPRDSKLGRLANVLLGQGLLVVLSKILFRLIVSVETLLLKRTRVHGDHYRIFDLRKFVDDVLVINPIVSKSGFVYRFSAEDVETGLFPFTTVTIELTEGVLQDSGSVITNGLRRVSLFNASPKNSTPETYWLEVRMRRATSIP